MTGLRVSGIPKKAEAKHVKIHFSKPENGGGVIKKIYYPLLNNDAVIIYQDTKVAERVLQNEHARVLGRTGGHSLQIQRLPEHSVFSSMQARINPDASVLLQASPALLDEFRYNEEIHVDFDEDSGTYLLSGNWYQLEWAWTYLDTFIQQQEVIQDEIKHQPFRMNASPMDVEDGGESDVSPATSISRQYGELSDSKRSAFYTESVAQETPNRERSTSAHVQPLLESSLRYQLPTDGNSLTAKLSHRTADHSQRSGYERVSSPVSSTGTDDDHLELAGVGYNIPDESIQMSLNPSSLGRKSDADATFSQFSGLHLNKHATTTSVDDYERTRKGKDNEKHATATSVDAYERTRKGKDNEKDQSFYDSLNRDYKGQIASPNSGLDEAADTRARSSSLSMRTDASHIRDTSQFHSMAFDGPRKNEVHQKPMSETYTTESDYMKFQFRIRGIDVIVLYGDLVEETTNAIVNPANSSLDHWGGASAAISKAAGFSLDKECKDFIRKNGNLKVAEVMHTNGGKLKAPYVLHTNGPFWYKGAKKDQVEYELTCTFLNCFNYAEKLSIRSLSVPAISTACGDLLQSLPFANSLDPDQACQMSGLTWIQTVRHADGVFGVPLDICIRSFLDALLIFGNDRASSYLRNVRLINKDDEATITSIVLLKTALEGDVEALASQAFEAYNKFKEKELHLPRGRPEHHKSFEFEAAQKAPVTKTLLQGSTSGLPETETAKRTHRRSSSMSRLSKSNTQKEENTRSTPRQSSVSGMAAEQEPRARTSSGLYGSLKRGDFSKSYSPQHTASSTAKVNTEKHKISTATPSLKQMLRTGSTASAKLKTMRKQTSSDSPSGKVRVRRGWDDIDDDKAHRAKSPTADSPSGKVTVRRGWDDTDDDRAHRAKSPTADSPSGKVRVRRGWDDTDDDRAHMAKSPIAATDRMESDFGLYSLPINIEGNMRGISHSRKTEDDEKCAICLDRLRRPKTLEFCKHTFCTACIDEHFKKVKPTCPICGSVYGKVKGTQPRDGQMTSKVEHNVSLPGFERADGTIVIKYFFPSGIQKAEHPNPGKRYKGLQRTAYLPNNSEGKQVHALLKKAFEARLVFTIGESRTTGKEDVLTWNDIHHKTNIFGGTENFGYPDSTYLIRVKQELADKGITSV